MSSTRFSSLVPSSSSGSSNSGSLSAHGTVKYDECFLFLGAPVLQRLNMAIMEEPLNSVTKQFPNSHGLILKHDYVLLQYAGGKWIKCEKGGESAHGKNDAGISLSPVDNLEDLKAIHGSSIRFQTNNILLGKGKEEWSLAKMNKLLWSHDPDYDFLGGNCWKYAYDCVEGVLNWCIKNAEEEGVREALEAKLDELKKVERPQPRNLLRSIVDPSAPQSVKATKVFKQKLAHTEEQLPDDSIFRRLGVKAIRKVIDPQSRSGYKAEPPRD